MRSIYIIGAAAGGLLLLTLGAMLGYALRPDSGAHVLARTADEWAALGTCATFVVAIVAAIIAFAQAAEARRLRIEQAQPYVVAYLEQDPSSPAEVDLVIRNFGTTAARDVRMEYSPPIQRTAGADVEDVWLPDSIPLLAPQQEWRTFWDTGVARLDHAVLGSAHRHEMTLTYQGVVGTVLERSESTLDWGAYVGRIFTMTKTTHHAAKALEGIAKTVTKWSEGSPGGIAVYSRDGDAKDTRQAAERQARAAERTQLKQRLERAQSGQKVVEPPADEG